MKPVLVFRLSALFILMFVILFYFLRISGLTSFGVDFSDEGRHLNEIKYAANYSWAATQYGLIIHPVANLINFNIPILRILNFALTFALAALVFYFYFPNPSYKTFGFKLYLFACSLAFGLLGITFFSVWLPTPSYYSATFQSLLLYSISIKVFASNISNKASLSRVVLIAFASAVVLFSKPTAFLIVWAITVITIWLRTSNRINHFLLYNSMVCLFLFLASMAWFGTPFQIFHRILLASRFMSIQDPAYKLQNVFRLDSFPYSWEIVFLLFLMSSILSAIVTLLVKESLRKQIYLIGVLSVGFSFLVYVFIQHYDFGSNPTMLLITTFFFSINLIMMNLNKRGHEHSVSKISSFTLICLPLAYALGTNGNLWVASTQAIFFIVVLSWVLIDRVNSTRLALVSQSVLLSLILVISVISIEYGLSNPYRQNQGIELQKTTAIKDPKLGNLRLSPEIEDKLSKTFRRADEVGFTKGEPIIDLTGQSPLTIFALGAFPVGAPWMVGGYQGSNLLAISVLKEVDCSVLTDSWILVEPGGPRSLEVESVLESFGSSLNNFILQARWETPEGAGGFSQSRLQLFYKPDQSQKQVRIQSCFRNR